LIGKAQAMGAVSLVNAIAAGKGATVAVRLPTSAIVKVERTPGEWEFSLNGKNIESPLAQKTIANTLLSIGEDPAKHSGSVETTSEAPIGVGLKTSSSSSVAISIATLAAFGRRRYSSTNVLNSSVSASLSSKASLTGALDDAASCLNGGANFADNFANRVLSSRKLGRPMTVLVRVPRGPSKRNGVSLKSVRRFAKEADEIFRLSERGKMWSAMTLNGLLYSSIYGYDPMPALLALEAGAVGAGLSGTGPAIAAIFDAMGEPDRLAEAWSEGDAEVIRTQTTDEGARIER
jgi:shikimate kinase